ncbi:hypothetical protein SDC9_181095 [bioreactor metagenome]|uniref:Uncharacterized protein n=1 Tax=bioreactor metagenome TaxID=1076179 RepID=A0A645H551_9ZZZZ
MISLNAVALKSASLLFLIREIRFSVVTPSLDLNSPPLIPLPLLTVLSKVGLSVRLLITVRLPCTALEFTELTSPPAEMPAAAFALSSSLKPDFTVAANVKSPLITLLPDFSVLTLWSSALFTLRSLCVLPSRSFLSVLPEESL